MFIRLENLPCKLEFKYMNAAKILLFATVLLFLPCVGLAQLTFNGQVQDAETGEPLSYASIRLQGTVIGAMSDKQGKFEFNLIKLNVILEISHVGYETRFVEVKNLRNGPMVIRLQPKEILVDDVVISDGLQKVLEDETLYLFDYEFSENELFILLYDKKRKEPVLALIDENDSIIATVPGPERPKELVKDCLGNVHMLTKNFACQIFTSDGEVGMYVDSLKEYQKYVEPCIGKIDEYYFYDYYRFNNQILHYYAYNGETREGDYFCDIKDEERMHQLLDPSEDNIYRSIATTEAEFLAITPSMWEKVGKLNKEFQFYQMAFFHPVHAPLRTIDGSIYIFDHVNGILRHHDPDGSETSKTPISYHERSKWDMFITVDHMRGDAYTSYTKHGVRTLAEIDLEDGSIIKEHKLPRQFAKEVTVRDGVVYFLYQEMNYDDVNRLYRLRIKD